MTDIINIIKQFKEGQISEQNMVDLVYQIKDNRSNINQNMQNILEFNPYSPIKYDQDVSNVDEESQQQLYFINQMQNNSSLRMNLQKNMESDAKGKYGIEPLIELNNSAISGMTQIDLSHILKDQTIMKLGEDQDSPIDGTLIYNQCQTQQKQLQYQKQNQKVEEQQLLFNNEKDQQKEFLKDQFETQDYLKKRVLNKLHHENSSSSSLTLYHQNSNQEILNIQAQLNEQQQEILTTTYQKRPISLSSQPQPENQCNSLGNLKTKQDYTQIFTLKTANRMGQSQDLVEINNTKNNRINSFNQKENSPSFSQINYVKDSLRNSSNSDPQQAVDFIHANNQQQMDSSSITPTKKSQERGWLSQLLQTKQQPKKQQEFNQFLERNSRWQSKKSSKLKQLEKKINSSEVQECSFKPQINKLNGFQGDDKNTNIGIQKEICTGQRLYQRSKSRVIEQKRDEMEQLKELEIKKNCTFTPQINDYPKYLKKNTFCRSQSLQRYSTSYNEDQKNGSHLSFKNRNQNKNSSFTWQKQFESMIQDQFQNQAPNDDSQHEERNNTLINNNAKDENEITTSFVVNLNKENINDSFMPISNSGHSSQIEENYPQKFKKVMKEEDQQNEQLQQNLQNSDNNTSRREGENFYQRSNISSRSADRFILQPSFNEGRAINNNYLSRDDLECKFKPKVNQINQKMETAREYLKKDVFERLNDKENSVLFATEKRSTNIFDKVRQFEEQIKNQKQNDDNAALDDINSSMKDEKSNPTTFLDRQKEFQLKKEENIQHLREFYQPKFQPNLNPNPTQSQMAVGQSTNNLQKQNQEQFYYKNIAFIQEKLSKAKLKQIDEEKECSFQPKITILGEYVPPKTCDEMSTLEAKRRELSLNQKRALEQQKEISQFTFHPQTNQNPEFKHTNSKLGLKLPMKDYVQQQRQLQNQKEIISSLYQQKVLQNELEQCTFSPNISSLPNYVQLINQQNANQQLNS